MNQDFDLQKFHLSPDTSPHTLEATLARLLVPGSVMDERLHACCRRLQDRFNLFVSTCPPPQWDKGLLITPEIRCQSETYLPLAEIQTAFRHLLFRSCRYQPFLPAVPIFSALSWPDALERMEALPFTFNPAAIIAALAADQSLRATFLASLFIPKRYGGSGNRYPRQKDFLQEWLTTRKDRKMAVLDAACGSGEGVYELAEMLAETGVGHDAAAVHGCTVEPLELVAAAHGWLPHDPVRARSLTMMIENVLKRGGAEKITFFREDICRPADNSFSYDVVICNGLLGGPLLHEIKALEAAVRSLTERVKPGGIILVADRFHAGWRRIIPALVIEELLAKYGIRVMSLPEGVGGIRSG